MDILNILNNYINNISFPSAYSPLVTLVITLVCVRFVVYALSGNNEKIIQENEVNDENDEELSEDKSTLEYIRDQIERFGSDINIYGVLQSVILPKKGDYVEINYGRWNGYVGRITNTLDNYDSTLYNINVSKKDNDGFGSDIPHFLLKDKPRDFFTVLTDNEVADYNLIPEDRTFERYVVTNY